MPVAIVVVGPVEGVGVAVFALFEPFRDRVRACSVAGPGFGRGDLTGLGPAEVLGAHEPMVGPKSRVHSARWPIEAISLHTLGTLLVAIRAQGQALAIAALAHG